MNELHCLQIDELLCDFVDGTLSAENKVAFEAHTAQCAACHGEFGQGNGRWPKKLCWPKLSGFHTPFKAVSRLIWLGCRSLCAVTLLLLIALCAPPLQAAVRVIGSGHLSCSSGRNIGPPSL